ncbi:MAG: hypothetical protein EAZ22_16950, partial [Cytophagales bacterium]
LLSLVVTPFLIIIIYIPNNILYFVCNLTQNMFSERMLMTDLKVVDVILADVDKFAKELK